MRPRIKHAAVAGLLVPLCLVVGVTAPPAGAAKAQHRGFVGQILYEKPVCPDSSKTHKEPVPGAKILVDAPGPGKLKKVGVVSASGHVSFRVPSKRVKLYLELDGKRISVKPDPVLQDPTTPSVGNRTDPYRIPTGEWTRGVARHVFLRGPHAGAANIWTVLNRAAALGAEVTAKHLPKVDAFWRFNPKLDEQDRADLDASFYRDATQQMFIHDSGLVDFTLEHEYGHHVLAVNDPFPNAGGDHEFTVAQPDVPGLAWSEGFAHAFSAIVDNDPVRKLTCKAQADLSTHPVTPGPKGDDLVHSQYVEGPVAGAIWDLTKVLGDGNRKEGLKKLIAAAKSYPPHPARSVSNVFDALLAAGFGSTPADFEAIRGAFAGQNIGWGTAIGGIEPALASGERGSLAQGDTQVTLSAPGAYGSCRVQDEHAQSSHLTGVPFQWYGTIGASGGLPSTWQDDCLVRGGDGSPPELGEAGSGPAALWLIHPYLADQSHIGVGFTVSVRYTCTDDQGDYDQTGDVSYLCPKDEVPLRAEVANGILDDQALASQDTIPPAFVNSPDVPTFNVPVGADAPLLRFDSQGHCEVLTTHTDCGI